MASYEGYKTISIRKERGVAFATINNPPMNLMTVELVGDLVRLAMEVGGDDEVKVIVFDSADPDYFIAHFDVGVLAQAPSEPRPKPSELHILDQAYEAFRTMPKVSIAKIEGRARGGGSEFVLSLDMRFGAIGRAVIGQPEVGLGIIPGGGGTQRLPHLMGRSRALEVVLGCGDFPAELAERYGYINRALPADELGPFVNDLAFRIALFPAEAIALAKKSVLNAIQATVTEGLLEETFLFNQSTALPVSKKLMNRFLAIGGQTREGEMNLENLIHKLYLT